MAMVVQPLVLGVQLQLVQLKIRQPKTRPLRRAEGRRLGPQREQLQQRLLPQVSQDMELSLLLIVLRLRLTMTRMYMGQAMQDQSVTLQLLRYHLLGMQHCKGKIHKTRRIIRNQCRRCALRERLASRRP